MLKLALIFEKGGQQETYVDLDESEIAEALKEGIKRGYDPERLAKAVLEWLYHKARIK